MSHLRPRLCTIQKGPTGYGFHLHTDKGKSGQFIRLVEPESPASSSGLLAGDRLMFVNGENVEDESHQQVVARIRGCSGSLELIVADVATVELLNKHELKCRKEFVTDGIVLPGGDSGSERGDAESSGTPRENGDSSSDSSRKVSVSSSTEQERGGPRPRFCHIKKGANGYGFNLHTEKSKQGQFIKVVDEDSPAQRAGLKAHDKIIQVNGISVIGMQHAEVVAAIRAGGDETKLLVVDAEAEEYFKTCKVQPSEYHLTGPLPVPVSERSEEEEEEEEEIPAERTTKASVSSSASSASSEAAAPTSTPPERIEKSDGEADELGIGLSVAQAKERAHQKRAAKKAPQMDWRKRNELFSSL